MKRLHTVYDSNSVILRKRQNHGESKKVSGDPGLEGWRDEEAKHKGCLGQ